MNPLTLPVSLLALLMAGAIFGFFYAWVCSTMWGLDAADPRTAIAAMQAMNASVRNAAFFPAFFLTGPVLGLAALLMWRDGATGPALWMASAAVIYLLGGTLLTLLVNVPMNEALARLPVPEGIEAAAAIWQDYSGPWQAWNLTRTVFSGVALACAGMALIGLRPAIPA